MDRIVQELIIMSASAMVFGFAFIYFTNLTNQTTQVNNAKIVVSSFENAINYLKSAYDGAEYTVANPNKIPCAVYHGYENTSLYKNVPYIVLDCQGYPEQKMFWVKLAVNSTTILNQPFIYIYRVYYDGQNMTIFIKT